MLVIFIVLAKILTHISTNTLKLINAQIIKASQTKCESGILAEHTDALDIRHLLFCLFHELCTTDMGAALLLHLPQTPNTVCIHSML